MADDRVGQQDNRLLGLSPVAWVQIAVVTVLMIATFRFNLVRLWGKTNPFNGQDSNWQHSIFVPLIGLYYLYIHRDDLLKAAAMPVRRERGVRILSIIGLSVLALLGLALFSGGEIGFPLFMLGALAAGLAVPVIWPTSTALGTVTLLEGLAIFAVGIFPVQNDYVKDLGMVITLFGAVTLLAGWPVMRVAWFPIAFLVVALPWPELVYAKLASPLQQLAASVAVGTMRLFGVTAQNFGTRIMFFDKDNLPRMLNVAEACAGLKSVMTFLMVAGTVAFLSARPLWEKLVISLSAIPIAIFCNVVRVAGQGLLDRYVSHEWSTGFAHQFAGLVMLIPGFFLIMFVGWALEKMFIEEVDKGKLGLSRAGGAAAAAGATAKSKRVIVEVPRKPAAPAAALVGEPALVGAGAPVTAVAGPVVVEKKASAPAGVGVGSDGVKPVARPAVSAPVARPAVAPAAPAVAPAVRKPVAPAAPAVPARPVAAPVANKPAVAPVAAKPAVAAATPPSTLKPSTLKPAAVKPAVAAPVAGPVATPPSTLKPSARPAGTVARTPATAVPPSGLKPSTLKPSAPKPPAQVGLKPSAPAVAKPVTPVAPVPPRPVSAQAVQQQQQQQKPKPVAPPPSSGQG